MRRRAGIVRNGGPNNPNNFPIVDTGTQAEPAFVEKIKQQGTASLLGELNDRRTNFTDGQLSAMYSEIVYRASNNRAGFAQQELYLLGMLKKGALGTSDSNALYGALPKDHNSTNSTHYIAVADGATPSLTTLEVLQEIKKWRTRYDEQDSSI
jgi:hypothetical protein